MKIEKLFKHYEEYFDKIFAIQLFTLHSAMFSDELEIFSLTVDYIADSYDLENEGITSLAAVFMFYERIADVDKKKLLIDIDNKETIDVLMAKANHKTLEGHVNSLLCKYHNLRLALELSKILIATDSITTLLDLDDVFVKIRTSIDENLYKIMLSLNPFTPREAEMIKYHLSFMLENKSTSLDCLALKILFSRLFQVEVTPSFILSPISEAVVPAFTKLTLGRDDIKDLYIENIRGNEENYVFQAGILLRLITFLLKELPPANSRVNAA